MNVVAILGVSGVGKSTTLRDLQTRFAFRHLEASALIKDEQKFRKYRVSTSEELRLGDILDNQDLMILGFDRSVANTQGLIIFDGHAIIDGITPIHIPPSVFQRIGAQHLISLKANPQRIVRNREQDIHRVRPVRTLDEIQVQQSLEIEAAKDIAAMLGLPFSEVDVENLDILAEILVRYL